MRTFCLVRLLLLVLCSVFRPVANANAVDLNKLDAIEVQKTAYSAQWKKLLYYVPAWGRGEVSLIDDPSFFLHAEGKTNPEFELDETLKAFSQHSPEKRQEALCKYPARRKFLEQKFNITFEDLDPQNQSNICKRYRVFSSKVKSESASLIFTSYYPGNPGSLFGHTLLKFKKKTDGETSDNALLDYGLNHAAFPTTMNPILYPIMGLGGMFPGMVSMMPYYVKVQEYNNAESRDIWEYELNLTPDEVALMLASVFELSTRRIDYYYFDDNCAYLMLGIIDVGRPSLDLVSKFNAWVIPGDTIRVIANVPSLVSKVEFRPSNVRKFIELESELEDDQRSVFNKLMFTRKNVDLKKKTESKLFLDALKGVEKEDLTVILDTALEYIDATEQISAAKPAVKWKKERDILLKKRAELGTISEPTEVETPENEAPHLAYPPTRLSLGIIETINAEKVHSPAALLGWRPALHTLDNPIAGMGADLGVGFFNLEFLAVGTKLALREFTPLSIEAIPLSKPNMSSFSWALDLGFRQRCFQGCKQTSINTELGYAFPMETPDGRYALRGGLRVGDDETAALFVEPALIAIANRPIGLDQRWVSRLSMSCMVSLWEAPQWLLEGSTTYVYRPKNPWELQVGAQVHNKELQMMARTLYYF